MQQAGKGFVEGGGAAAGIPGGGVAVVRDEASCIVQEGSGDSGSTLKAHDYIGLSEVTSMPLKPESASGKPLPDLNLGETELRLGPPKTAAKDPAKIPLPATDKAEQQQQQQQQKQQGKDKDLGGAAGGVFWQQAAPPPPQPTVEMFCNVASMNKNKRVFSEAIGSNGQFVDGRSVMPNPPGIGGGGGGPGAAGSSVPAQQQGSSAGKVAAATPATAPPPLMPSSMYPWNNGSKMPAAWRMGLEQSKGSFGPFPSSSRAQPKMKDEPSSANNSHNSSGITSNKEEGGEDAVPSASPPVVGWPPVQSFRKNLASHPPPPPPQHKASETSTKNNNTNTSAPSPAPAAAASTASASPLFVKVYMDGVPIGRKVDLKTNNSYEKLSSVLEEMFLRFITGQNGAPEVSSLRDPSEKKLNFLQSSDFVLTYEDKDGDLMLVGDVPWGMFTGTVKRLRIMKGSEAIGLAPRAAAAAGDKAQA